MELVHGRVIRVWFVDQVVIDRPPTAERQSKCALWWKWHRDRKSLLRLITDSRSTATCNDNHQCGGHYKEPLRLERGNGTPRSSPVRSWKVILKAPFLILVKDDSNSPRRMQIYLDFCFFFLNLSIAIH